jgi:hypothetical protein
MIKGITRLVVVFVLFGFLMASCRKDYHCQCSYKNQVTLVKDLGQMVKSDAEDNCSALDSTVAGEKWTCIIY